MYFGVRQSREWIRGLAALATPAAAIGVELAVLPTFPLLESTAATLASTGISWGAQDVAADDAGNQTGEVAASVLAELGCRYVEVGHSERRTAFAESDDIVRSKVERIVAHGMIPLLCVGEPAQGLAQDAAEHCVGQALDALRGVPQAQVVVAYEPCWAIGAAHAAPAAHIGAVTLALRTALGQRAASSRVLYGGSAGPGTATELGSAVDGLFLGRFAHDLTTLRAVLDELGAIATTSTKSPLSTGSRSS
ncbi:triose-phosphate isomerase [Cellulomonas sp. WB94]|nr:triose-phosphate isomerase [Cellulomonas sp. WB94]